MGQSCLAKIWPHRFSVLAVGILGVLWPNAVWSAVGDKCDLLSGDTTRLAQDFVYPVGTESDKPSEASYDPNGYIVSQRFNNVDRHTGVDLEENGKVGGGAVRAIADGRVVYRQEKLDGWGYMIRIEHRLSDGSFIYSQYAHLLENMLFADCRDDVNAGQLIALVGNTGASTGPHLHLEVKTIDVNGCGYIPGKDNLCKNDMIENYRDPLAFIEDSMDAGPPPGTLIYVPLVEGDPGVPGDGILVSSLGGLHRILFEVQPLEFQFQSGQFVIVPVGAPVFSLNGIRHGITVSAFLPPTVPETAIVELQVSLYVQGAPVNVCSVGVGGSSDQNDALIVNGVRGVAAVLTQDHLNRLVEIIRATPDDRCRNASIDDLILGGIIPFIFEPPSNVTFISDVDAVAVGVGENVFPTEATLRVSQSQ